MKKYIQIFALVLTICSTVQAQIQIPNINSPVGTQGVLKGWEAIVVELGSTVSILAGSDKPLWDPDDTAVVKKDYDEDDEFL